MTNFGGMTEAELTALGDLIRNRGAANVLAACSFEFNENAARVERANGGVMSIAYWRFASEATRALSDQVRARS